MPCEVHEELICAWVDSELPNDQCAQLTEHVRECPRCARLQAEFVSTKALLRQRVPSVDVPTHFWSNVRRRMDVGAPSVRPRVGFGWQRWAVAAAVLVLAVALGRVGVHLFSRPEPLIPAELAHVYETHRDHKCQDERAVSDPVEGAHWLTQIVGYRVPAVNYAPAGYELSHVTSCYCFTVKRQPEKGAIFAFKQQQQDWRVCLFVHHAAAFDVPLGQSLTIDGQKIVANQNSRYNILSWKSGDRVYSVVSELPQEELLKLTRIKPIER
jgi:hypothetical protein